MKNVDFEGLTSDFFSIQSSKMHYASFSCHMFTLKRRMTFSNISCESLGLSDSNKRNENMNKCLKIFLEQSKHSHSHFQKSFFVMALRYPHIPFSKKCIFLNFPVICSLWIVVWPFQTYHVKAWVLLILKNTMKTWMDAFLKKLVKRYHYE